MAHRRSRLHAAGHTARMAARPVANRLTGRRDVRGPGHVVEASEAVLRGVHLHLRGSGHRVFIAPQARLSRLRISLVGTGHHLVIGSHVQIHSGEIAIEDDGGVVRIGERTTIYGAAFGVTEGGSVVVGADCLLSTGVDLRNGDSHAIVDAATGERLNPAADVEVGDHVWIGHRAMLLKGARVGAGSVVGAGATVVGPLPATCVAAGSPARVVREGATWTRER